MTAEMTKKKESIGLKASKILYVVNALWQKKAMLQILFGWRSCPVGLLFFHNSQLAGDTCQGSVIKTKSSSNVGQAKMQEL